MGCRNILKNGSCGTTIPAEIKIHGVKSEKITNNLLNRYFSYFFEDSKTLIFFKKSS